jgi:hypothetical protein
VRYLPSSVPASPPRVLRATWRTGVGARAGRRAVAARPSFRPFVCRVTLLDQQVDLVQDSCTEQPAIRATAERVDPANATAGHCRNPRSPTRPASQSGWRSSSPGPAAGGRAVRSAWPDEMAVRSALLEWAESPIMAGQSGTVSLPSATSTGPSKARRVTSNVTRNGVYPRDRRGQGCQECKGSRR